MNNIPEPIADRLVLLRMPNVDTNDNERRTTSHQRVILTQAEILGYSREAADAQAEIKRLEADLGQIKKAMQAKIDGQVALLDLRSEAIRNGYEVREVECVDVLDTPTKGKKTTYRLDTYEQVSVTIMTDSERQRMLKFDEREDARKKAVAMEADTPTPANGRKLPKLAGAEEDAGE